MEMNESTHTVYYITTQTRQRCSSDFSRFKCESVPAMTDCKRSSIVLLCVLFTG